MIPVSMVVYWMMILWLKKVIPMSMMVYWMLIFWLKQSDTCFNGGLLNDDTLIKESDTCINDSILNDDILIKTKWYLCQ